MPAKVRKRLPATERKNQILKSAVKVFARSNYRAATVAEIAAEAGISEAMIYKHFPSKRSLLLRVLKHVSRRIIELWQAEVEKTQDAMEAMRNMALLYYKRMADHPQELRVQFQAISEIGDSAIARQLRLDHRSYIDFIESVIREGMRQGTVRSDLDSEALAVLFDGIGILMNLMRLLADKKFDAKKVEKIVDHLLESIKP